MNRSPLRPLITKKKSNGLVSPLFTLQWPMDYWVYITTTPVINTYPSKRSIMIIIIIMWRKQPYHTYSIHVSVRVHRHAGGSYYMDVELHERGLCRRVWYIIIKIWRFGYCEGDWQSYIIIVVYGGGTIAFNSYLSCHHIEKLL